MLDDVAPDGKEGQLTTSSSAPRSCDAVARLGIDRDVNHRPAPRRA